MTKNSRPKGKAVRRRSAPKQRQQGFSPTAELAEQRGAQISFRVRPALKKSIRRKAAEESISVQTLILLALRNVGVDVMEADLEDLRKSQRRDGNARRQRKLPGPEKTKLSSAIRRVLLEAGIEPESIQTTAADASVDVRPKIVINCY